MKEDDISEMKEISEKIISKVNSKSEVKIQKSGNSIETLSKISANYDLLILGTPEKDNWRNVLFGTGRDKFADSSACSVLRLTMKE